MLSNEITKNKLTNIHLIDYQRRDTIPHIINYADIHFIFMDKKLEKDGLPSKVYTIMACKKPLLVISGENTPLYHLFRDTDAAFLLEDASDKNITKIEQVIHAALTDRSLLQSKGINGYNLVHKHYSKEMVTNKYYQYITYLMNN